MRQATAKSFVLPDDLSATEPPEALGIARDEVRLLVARTDALAHARFRDIGSFLTPGDLMVVNTSATLAAALDGRKGSDAVVVHFSAPMDNGTWVVELRHPDGSGPMMDAHPGEVVELPAGRLILCGLRPGSRRLWTARAVVEGSVESYLERHGRPISYGYVRGRWPITAYQTIFGREHGSAEMASASRPLSERLLVDLMARGVVLAPVLLHAGVSSLEGGEPPQPERFRVPEATARLVNDTRRAGGRVVAVGTTVTRALETVARPDGTIEPAEGWTDLVLGPDRPARTVTGLVTGWHAPDASHLMVLESVSGAQLVGAAYVAALEARYRWHEFGDSCLFLPGGRRY